LSPFVSETKSEPIKGSFDLAITFETSIESSSLFFSLKPVIVYSTSLAVWEIMREGLLWIFGLSRRGFYLWALRIRCKSWSSFDLIEQLSSSNEKMLLGGLSINSMTGVLSLKSICPQN
jgi:hypothetical protein